MKPVPINRLKLAGADPNEAEQDASNVFEVPAVINHQDKDGKRLYRVQWRGYQDPKHDTWEPMDSFHNRLPIQEYWDPRRGQKRGTSKAMAESANLGSKRTKVVATGSNLTPMTAEASLRRSKRQRGSTGSGKGTRAYGSKL
jgi:hypothetical protein